MTSLSLRSATPLQTLAPERLRGPRYRRFFDTSNHQSRGTEECEVLAMLMPGVTVVVSPSMALMRDQFDRLSGLGLTAVQVNRAVPAVGHPPRARRLTDGPRTAGGC